MSRTVDTETTYLTQDRMVATVVDGILSGSMITDLFMANGKAWQGEQYKIPLKYQKSTAMGWYTGMGSFDTTQQKNLVQMAFTPASVYGSVTLPYFELSINKSLPVIRQEAYAMKSAADDLIDTIGDAFYGTGSGNQCDGLRKLVDDGTVSATYGGLTRSSYSTALTSDISTSVGSITLDTIGASLDGASIGSQQPDLIITTPTLWRAIEDLLFPSVSATYGAAGSKRGLLTRMGDVGGGQSLTGLAGYTALYYRNIPIVKDEKCPSGYIFYLNKNFMFWSGLSHAEYGMASLGDDSLIEGVSMPAPRNHGIAWTGWKQPINQDGKTGQFIAYGQMICSSPRHQALDSGCTA